MKRKHVFTSVSMGTHIEWVTNGSITQTTMMTQGQILKRAEERGVRKSCVLSRVKAVS